MTEPSEIIIYGPDDSRVYCGTGVVLGLGKVMEDCGKAMVSAASAMQGLTASFTMHMDFSQRAQMWRWLAPIDRAMRLYRRRKNRRVSGGNFR